MGWVKRRVRRTRRVVRELSGRTRFSFVKFLLAQISFTIEGTELAIRMTRGDVATDVAREEMSGIEHQGDGQRAQLVHALGEALTTPIDREDLYRLSRSVDDVLDNLRDFVREADLYSTESLAPMTSLLEAVAAGLRDLERAVAGMVAAPDKVNRYALDARKSTNQVRVLYQVQLEVLFRGTEVTMDVLKMRELLRRLDVVALRLTEATDTLNDAMLKRSM